MSENERIVEGNNVTNNKAQNLIQGYSIRFIKVWPTFQASSTNSTESQCSLSENEKKWIIVG